MSNVKPFNKNPNSMIQRVIKFFEDNPEEFLTFDDMVVKFNMTTLQAANIRTRLCETGNYASEKILRFYKCR